MSKKNKKKQTRAAMRKNRTVRTRNKDITRAYDSSEADDLDLTKAERISGKGDLTRHRTVLGAETIEDAAGANVQLDVDESACLRGRVLRSMGLHSVVQAEDGRLFQCATRRLLKTLSTDQRHVVVAGDVVLFLPEGEEEGMIQRVEPRHGVISRSSRGRQHIIVSNVDQVVIVTSAAEPRIKPNLIDRLLVTTERSQLEPILCINKIDLVEPADLQPLVGVYSQMGYQVLLVSATTGEGLDRLRRRFQNRHSVVTGQSGVGKSSLLNALDSELSLRVSHVSGDSQKGRHTTTTAQLLPWSFGGFVVDTPGVRQFQLWDVIPTEVAGFYRDIRSYVSHCHFPNCTHTHEADCAVKHAVADGRIDARRYESYVYLFRGDEFVPAR